MAGAERWLLLDKSALVRGADFDPTLGEPCLCPITGFEVLYSARSARAYEQVEAELDALHELRTDAETIAIARTAQRELAATSQHRVPIPDLLIAACAQQPPGRRPPSRPPLRNAGARPLLHACAHRRLRIGPRITVQGRFGSMCSGTTPQPVHPDDPHARHRVELGVLGCRRGARAVAAIREWRIAEPSRSRRRALEIAALSGTGFTPGPGPIAQQKARLGMMLLGPDYASAASGGNASPRSTRSRRSPLIRTCPSRRAAAT